MSLNIIKNWVKQSKYHLNEETGWGYWFHLFHSLKNSYRLLVISFYSMVHGLFPWIWKSKAPIAVINLYREIMKIQHLKKLKDDTDKKI